MRNVDTHLLEDKMDEAVTHYINSHQPGEQVHVDTNGLALNVQDESGRVVTVMPGQGFPSQMSRQVSVGEHVEGGPWNEELMDPEMRLAALVAHLTHQSRTSHHHPTSHQKLVSSVRDVDSVLIDAPMRLFNGQPLDTQQEPIVVQVPALPPLPPLQEMKRCQEADWFNKDKNTLKESGQLIQEAEGPMIELNASASPAQNKQNKKSLPHKKRISRKLKRNTGNSTPQQDIVVINCTEDVQQEEILPDNYVTNVPHQDHLTEDTHHMTQEVRPCFICQLCGEFYGEEQLKFFHHLKHHYEPHNTIIIENPVTDLAIDKMTNTCIVDNGATLPDSIVELSLESTVPKTMYQPIDKHILYSSSDKTLYTNKVQYSMANTMDKDPGVPTVEAEKSDLYDTLDKLELYSCIKCNKSFRKQKQCEAHIKEAHSNSKLDDMGEFSEPEDLMEGIHVAVEEGAEQYEHTLLPHLTVENGQVHQEHVRHWYTVRGSGGAGVLAACAAGAYCPVCPAPPPRPHDHTQLKEEVLQRIFDSEVSTDQNFSDNIIQDNELPPEPEPEPHPVPEEPKTSDTTPNANNNKKKVKKCECLQCGRVFFHRNSLLYHMLSHREKQHECKECGKGFYTANALKVHSRVHNGSRPYKCDECGREFRQWSDLKYHKVSLHSNQKHFKCEYCGKEFARRYSLSVHRRIHTGEKNYKCDYCNKTFRASSYRQSHMRTHTGDRPYKCTICEKGFRVAGDLRRHTFTHEKVRNRFDEHKKPKDEKDTKSATTEVKVEPKEQEETPQKVKKIAVASTTRPPLLKNVEKKQKPIKKTALKKDGAPNVTVTQTRSISQINTEYTNNVEVFDTRQEFNKYKVVYADSNVEYNKDNSYKVKEYSDQMTSYKENEQEREFAVMRPMYRNNICEESEKSVFIRPETTDGKMNVYTHIEKGNMPNSISLGDIRIDQRLERDRSELHGEGIENGFLENLTALYNISAV